MEHYQLTIWSHRLPVISLRQLAGSFDDGENQGEFRPTAVQHLLVAPVCIGNTTISGI